MAIVIFMFISAILWILALLAMMFTEDPISENKNWARRLPVVLTCIHASLWITSEGGSGYPMFFFLWLSIVLMDFLPSEKKI